MYVNLILSYKSGHALPLAPIPLLVPFLFLTATPGVAALMVLISVLVQATLVHVPAVLSFSSVQALAVNRKILVVVFQGL